MSLEFHNVLYAGMIASIVPVIKLLTVLVAVSYTYSYLVLPEFIGWLRSSVKLRRIYVRWKKKIFGKRKQTQFERSAKENTVKAFLITCGLVSFIGFLASVEAEGKAYAREVLSGGEEGARRTITINGDGRSLIFLACGARNCAAYEPQSDMIMYFDQAKGFSYLKGIKISVESTQDQAKSN